MAKPTVPQILDDVRNEAAGWLDQLVLYWDSLFANEKQLCFAILQSRGGGGGVTMSVEDGYVTLTDGVDTVNVPTQDITP